MIVRMGEGVSNQIHPLPRGEGEEWVGLARP
jgi:hypothetical protein